jgi:hypothetical protein
VVEQRLTPGVQHGGDADLGAKSVLTERQQGLAAGGKQQRVKGTLVLLDEGIELVWQRKDQMEIGHGQQGRFLAG